MFGNVEMVVETASSEVRGSKAGWSIDQPHAVGPNAQGFLNVLCNR